MGFSGDYVVARTDQPLLEVALFASGCAEGHIGCLSACAPRPGGWQTIQVLHGLPNDGTRVLQALVEATAAPALIANVMDSDLCDVRGLGTSGVRWSTLLDPAMAADYGIRVSSPGPVELIAQWAAEAGFEADHDALRETLAKKADPFVEDLLFELIDSCGFPLTTP
ncbi:hypothetical protein [Streptacidiphilus sp. PAMC 29251]